MPIHSPIDNYYKFYDAYDEDDDEITIITSNATNMKKSSRINAFDYKKLSSHLPTTIYGTVIERVLYEKETGSRPITRHHN